MRRWYSQEEVGDRIDCIGNFDPEDEICLNRCGINILCASIKDHDLEFELLDEMLLDFPH